jgi:ATP-dependent DNA helicase RecQ
MPDCIESYFQEAGRAGRDGKQSVATLLYHNQDIVNAKRKVKESFPPIERIKIIYEALGNYFQLPEGSGKDQGFDFDIVRFSEHFEFNLMEVYNAIKIIEREGYLFFSESAGQYSKLFIPIGKEELYRIMVENPGSERLLKDILRSYAGVFTDYININENQLAKRTELSRDDVIKRLAFMDNQKIISYIPIKTRPQIVYAIERLSTKNIFFSRENYSYLKEAAEGRLQSLLDFISNSIQCRSQQLLKYFGEKKSTRCGICDVCLSKNKTDLNQLQFDIIRTQIKETLQKGPVHLYNLISSLETKNEEDIITVLRWQMENGEVIKQSDEKLKWHKQLDIKFD